MCTLSLITRDDGYLLGMNRDESLVRGRDALPPAITGTALFPREASGGTWIAANVHGITLALLNWYELTDTAPAKQRSRGELIPELMLRHSDADVQNAVREARLTGMLPFRLVGVFGVERSVREWRWDGTALESETLEWTSQHWFSSGLSDQQAREKRGATCEPAWQREDAGSLEWLRELHASHEGGAGPFSVCVHRETVGSVSYTEVEIGPDAVRMRYVGGRPCERTAEPTELSLPLAGAAGRGA